MTLAVLLTGVFLGVVLTLAVAGAAVWYVVVRTGKPAATTATATQSLDANTSTASASAGSLLSSSSSSAAAADKRPSRLDWPPAVVRFLRNALETEPVEESAKWLNVVLIRFYLELRKSDLYKERLRRKFVTILQKKIAQTGFVKNVSLTELHFGDFPPRIQRAQLVQDRSLNEDLVVQVDFDLVYQGGITLTIEVELAAGVLVPVTVLVTGFMGKLRLRLPRPENATEFNISFVTDPNLTLQVQSRFVRNDNEYSLFQNQLNSFLAKKLQSIFVDTWTLPVWRFFDLPLVSMPTFVHPNCKCNLNAPIKPIGDLSSSTPTTTSTPSLFAMTVTPMKETVLDLSDGLIQRVLNVFQDTGINDWQVLKNKNGILVQKEKRRLVNRDDAAVIKGTVAIRCDPKRVFHILSNPQLNRHIDPEYLGYNNLEDYGEGQMLRHIGYKKRDTVVYEVARKLPGTALDTWVMAQRSVQMPAGVQSAWDPTKHARAYVHLFAYHVEAIAGDKNVCTVVCMSQLSPTLKNQNVSWQRLVETRSIIEQLLARVKNQAQPHALPQQPQPQQQPQQQQQPHTPQQQQQQPLSSVLKRLGEAGSSQATTPTSAADDRTAEQAMLSLDDANGIQRVVDEDGDGEEDDDNNNDDEHDGGGDDEEANVVVDDDHAEDEPPLSSRSGATAPIRPTGSQAPVPLSITSRVTSDTYKELAKETLEYFLAYARKENDTLYLKPWRQVKSNTPSVSVVRKMLDESTPADVLRANIALNVKPETVFAALKGPRYRNVANPDLVTCDTLVQYEDGVAVRNYRYKGSLLPDRDCVVLEVSQQISSTEWVVIQRSVAGDDVVARDAVTLRFHVYIAGYYINTEVADPNASACTLTHVSQLSADYATVLLSWLRVAWARNLPRVKYALERSSESVATTILPRETSMGYSDGIVKAGGLMWLALHHTASPIMEDGASQDESKQRRGQLIWEFSTRSNDIHFGVVFVPHAPAVSADLQLLGPRSRAPSVQFPGGVPPPSPPSSAPVRTELVNLSSKDVADRIPPWEGKGRSVLPSARFNSHVCPISGSVNASFLSSGIYYLLWDNRFARFTDKQVTYKATIVYSTVEASSAHHDHEDGLPDANVDPLASSGSVDDLSSSTDAFGTITTKPLSSAASFSATDESQGGEPSGLIHRRRSSTPSVLSQQTTSTTASGSTTPPLLNNGSPKQHATVAAAAATLPPTSASASASASPYVQSPLNAGQFMLPAALLPIAPRTPTSQKPAGTPRPVAKIPLIFFTVAPTNQALSGDTVINRKERLRVPLDLQVPWEEVKLVWEFRSGKDDIEFSIVWEEFDALNRPIYMPNGEPRRTTILPTTHVTPVNEQETVSGELALSGKQGRYVFVWDNQFSRWKNKNLSFSVALMPTANANANAHAHAAK